MPSTSLQDGQFDEQTSQLQPQDYINNREVMESAYVRDYLRSALLRGKEATSAPQKAAPGGSPQAHLRAECSYDFSVWAHKPAQLTSAHSSPALMDPSEPVSSCTSAWLIET